MESTGPIVVIGSINMDLVCRGSRIPRPGETVLGNDLMVIPGGKGANQAVGAAKLSAGQREVYLVGRVGEDDFGQRLLNGLDQHRVRTNFVTITEGAASGVAMILVDRVGENAILVAPGANHRLTPADLDSAGELIGAAAAVVLQLEIPLQTVAHAIAMCREAGVTVILDPAPAPPGGLPPELYKVDLLAPNRGEAEALLGLEENHAVTTKTVSDAKQIGSDLLLKGAGTVVLKLGREGAAIVTREGQVERVRPFKVKVVDTTAAGDAFTAALAVAHAEGRPLVEAVRFANAAGAICCQSFGAQPALPTREAVEKLLAR